MYAAARVGSQTRNSLYEAALAGDAARLAKLVANGQKLEEDGVVLQLAAEGQERAIELLVQTLGSRVLEVRDADHYTPLLVAVQEGHTNVVRKLLEIGADVLAATNIGPASTEDQLTALHLAAFNGDLQIVEELLKALVKLPPPSTLDLKNSLNRTPLHYAAGKGNLEAARLLIESGASKHARDSYGATPFHFAARCGQTQVLDLLQLEDVNDPTTTTKMTALHYAACKGHDSVVKWLLAHQASTDVQDEIQGNTPLHWAAKTGSASVAEILMAGGANALLMNNNKQMALALADEAVKEHRDAAKAILRGIKVSGENNIIRKSLWNKNSENGATLLHYFAGYGTAMELEWIVSLIQIQPPYSDDVEQEDINTKDYSGRNAVHWAAMKGNKEAVSILAKNNADLNAYATQLGRTPLSLAVINGAIELAEELLKWQPRDEDWLGDIGTWMQVFITSQVSKDSSIAERIESLKAGYDEHTKPSIFPQHVEKPYGFEIPPIYLALHIGKDDMAYFLQQHSRRVEGAVNERGKDTGRTALHWATLLQEREIVAQLCQKEVFAQALAADVEDVLGKTALQYAKEMGLREIEKKLLLRSDVTAYVDGLYRDRQVYVDAANAILVGAALISGVTFAGWLQPPLGYLSYYDFPEPGALDDHTYQEFAGVKQHIGVRMFWIFNSLSFSFGIASMIACLVGVVPIPRIYIATTVQHLRRCLLTGSALLGLSIVFVLAAFGAAGFAVLPPSLKYRTNMMATTIAGGIPCVVLLAWFACRLWSIRPRWLKAIEEKVMGKQLCAPRRQLSRKYSSTHVRRNPSNIPPAPTQDLAVGPCYQNVPWDDGLDSVYVGKEASWPLH